MTIIPAALFFLFAGPASALEIPSENKRLLDNSAITLKYEVRPDSAGAGDFSVELYGRSFISGGKLSHSSPVKARWNSRNLRKCFLIWSGEVLKKEENAPGLTLTRGQESLRVTPEKQGWERSTGWVYAGFADITDFAKKGDFTINALRSDPVEPGDVFRYSTAGWALLVLKNAPGAKTNDKRTGGSRIALYLGPWILAPGEVYDFDIPAGGKNKMTKLGIIGGHGIKGNATGNLLNSMAVTGRDDWTGSSGELWDVVMYNVSAGPKEGNWTVSFDPILQWIFPVAIMVSVR
ncbi:MAG: hypothetical protein ABIG11_04760 [bacterium]